MIALQQMTYGYSKKKTLFKDLSLSMEGGNIYGLLGLNGAGKSTLMKIIAGLLFPTGGELSVLGFQPQKREPDFLQDVFMLPEELYTPKMTGLEYLKIYTPFYPLFSQESFDSYLKAFSLEADAKLSKLSYGQKKKFLLSFGLACNSKILILDEPTNGLDIPSKSIFRRLVAEAITPDRVFILSTHQVRDVDSLIDPITILHEGEILLNMSLAELSKHIHMSFESTAPQASDTKLLYTEPSLAGHWAVWQGADEEGGPMDLEVLFNTFIHNPQAVKALGKGVWA